MQEAMQQQIINLTTMPVPSQMATIASSELPKSHTLPPTKTFGMAKWRASQKVLFYLYSFSELYRAHLRIKLSRITVQLSYCRCPL